MFWISAVLLSWLSWGSFYFSAPRQHSDRPAVLARFSAAQLKLAGWGLAVLSLIVCCLMATVERGIVYAFAVAMITGVSFMFLRQISPGRISPLIKGSAVLAPLSFLMGMLS